MSSAGDHRGESARFTDFILRAHHAFPIIPEILRFILACRHRGSARGCNLKLRLIQEAA
jgi:hypothetical protein